MRDINQLIFFLYKIIFRTYININNDEKFEYFKRVLYDNFHDHSIFRIERIIYGLDELIQYFDRTNERLNEYWC